MKILIEIQDNKANFFLELLKSFKFIKSQKVIDEEEYDPEFVKKNKSKKTSLKRSLFYVRVKGLEPPHLSALEPKSSVSTNFTTPAFSCVQRYQILELKSYFSLK